ncbi:hypothetical protein H8S10_01255 [Clostridium sp. NSJ-49]|uniref:hypothetical protein n=1 Tax=Clostridium TaxID=1485 RepID=UPI00164B7033|nr:hypothetical protein [Clostridium sp. NSJ-49]MBC5624088.1 hypothetical protein [Clostridium sp. NSJ-49]MDY3358799.1 hypothetical protein [Clostridium celatum]
MNKKLFLRLGVLLLSLSLVACGPKDNFSKTNSNKSNNKTQSSIKKEENNIKQGTAPDVKEENKVNKDTNSPELFIVAGGSNKVPGVCEYYLSELEVTPRIKPSINTKNSSYYDEKNQDNIYVDVVFDVYNLSNEAKMADDIITTKIKIKNNEYSCFSLVESTDGSDLEKDASINPLEERNIHYVAEVPIVDSTTGELEVILTINGKNFSNKFQLDSIQSSVKENTEQNTQSDVKQGLTEEEYYIIIKEAKQRQQDYIDSIDDTHIKQSVQSSLSAAIAESSALYIKYPDDTDTIDAALKRVLDGE